MGLEARLAQEGHHAGAGPITQVGRWRQGSPGPKSLSCFRRPSIDLKFPMGSTGGGGEVLTFIL